MKPSRPPGLGPAGAKLWRDVTQLTLDVGDQALLAEACYCADEIAAMRAALAERGLWVAGAAGQERLSPLVGALNVARGRLARLLFQVLPEQADEEPSVAASRMAQRRWRRRGA